jgi:ABC-type transport system involved in cytochrome c biogenesis ATPase subunit
MAAAGAVKVSDTASYGISAGMRRQVLLARMEADVAYFQARLEMLGEPLTSNQTAQRKLFKHLYNRLSSQVAAARQTQTKAFSIDGLFDG